MREEHRSSGFWLATVVENERRLCESAAEHSPAPEQYFQAWASDRQKDWMFVVDAENESAAFRLYERTGYKTYSVDTCIASFATAWFDDVSRTAYSVPVATVPAHQRHRLGKAVILEGLHRLKRMGCQVAFIGGYSQAANALYFSVLGAEHDVSEPWEKTV